MSLMRCFSAVVALAALSSALFGIFGGAQASPGASAATDGDGLLPGEVLERVEFALFDARTVPEGTTLAGAADLTTFTANGRWADSALPVQVRYVFATDPKEISAFGSLLWSVPWALHVILMDKLADDAQGIPGAAAPRMRIRLSSTIHKCPARGSLARWGIT
jgi:hypothetical protein